MPGPVRRTEVIFHPDEAGRDQRLDDLSDGQRFLSHVALTGATLDAEAAITPDAEGFDAASLGASRASEAPDARARVLLGNMASERQARSASAAVTMGRGASR